MAKTKSKTRKGEPFSIRLSIPTQRLIEHEARRLKRSKSAVVEELAEEAARTRRFAGIGFRGEDARRRAWVVGSGLDVWEIVQMAEDFGSVERLVAETHLTQRQARLALAYQAEHTDEIDELVAENRRPVEELRSLFPFIELAGRRDG